MGIPSLPYAEPLGWWRRIAETVNAILNQWGQWLTPAFSAANFSADGAMTWTVSSGGVITYTYTLIGNTMTVAWDVNGTAGGTVNTALQIAIPGGKVASAEVIGFALAYNNGSWVEANCVVLAGGTVISIYNSAAGNTNWTAGAANTQGSLTFPVN